MSWLIFASSVTFFLGCVRAQQLLIINIFFRQFDELQLIKKYFLKKACVANLAQLKGDIFRVINNLATVSSGSKIIPKKIEAC